MAGQPFSHLLSQAYPGKILDLLPKRSAKMKAKPSLKNTGKAVVVQMCSWCVTKPQHKFVHVVY